MERPDGSTLAILPMKVDFSDRFLAKLALGFAHNICGEGTDLSPFPSSCERFFGPVIQNRERGC